jgi:hypothetical protein
MQTDDELAELFERAIADLAPDINAMVNRAEQLGRGRRRRSRFWQAAGSALAIVVVAGAGYAAWSTHLLAPGRQADRARSAALSAGAASTGRGQLTSKQARQRAAERQAAAPTRRAAALKPMTPRQMRRTLRSLLPASAVLTNDPTAANKPGWFQVNYNDGNGMVNVMIDVTPFSEVVTSDPGTMIKQSGTSASLPTVLKLSCPDPLWTDEGARPAGALPISCLVRTPPGGGVERDAVMYADGYGFYGYDIYDQRPDNVEVFIQVGNGYFDPYLPHVDRATPPGSMSLWESVVESPAWRA